MLQIIKLIEGYQRSFGENLNLRFLFYQNYMQSNIPNEVNLYELTSKFTEDIIFMLTNKLFYVMMFLF